MNIISQNSLNNQVNLTQFDIQKEITVWLDEVNLEGNEIEIERTQTYFNRSLSFETAKLAIQAERCRYENQLQSAYEVYSQLLKFNPLDDFAITGQAEIHRQQGDAEQAKANLNFILKLYPQHLFALTCLGRIHLAEKKFQEATSIFNTIHQHYPTLATPLAYLAEINQLQENMLGALSLFDQAVTQNPQNQISRELRLQFFRKVIGDHTSTYRKKELELTLKPLREALNNAPNDEDIKDAINNIETKLTIFDRPLDMLQDDLALMKHSYYLIHNHNEWFLRKWSGDKHISVSQIAHIWSQLKGNPFHYHRITLAKLKSSETEDGVQVLLKKAAHLANGSFEDKTAALDLYNALTSILPEGPEKAQVIILQQHLLYPTEDQSDEKQEIEKILNNLNDTLKPHDINLYRVNKIFGELSDPKHPHHRFRHDIMLAEYARIKGGHQKEALEIYNDVLTQCSDIAYILISRAEIYRAQSRFNDAIDDCNRALKIDKNDPFAFTIRGQVYFQTGQYDHALQDADQAIRLYDHYHARLVRGCVHEQKGEIDLALEDIQKASTLNPDDYTTYRQCGILLVKKKKYQEGVERLNQVLQRYPDDPLAPIYIAYAYLQQGRVQKAFSTIDAFMKKENNPLAHAYAVRGFVYCGKEQANEAYQDLRKSIDLGLADIFFKNQVDSILKEMQKDSSIKK